MFNTKSIEFQLITVSFLINLLLIQVIKISENYHLAINNFCLSLMFVAIFVGLKREFSTKTTLIGMSVVASFIMLLYCFL